MKRLNSKVQGIIIRGYANRAIEKHFAGQEIIRRAPRARSDGPGRID